MSEDVIERVAPVVQGLGFLTQGGAYEAFRDTPYVTLIQLVEACGATVLTAAQKTKTASARILMNRGTAYETPLADDVIERLAPVVAATYTLTLGGFYEAVKDRPISTFLRWALYLGAR